MEQQVGAVRDLVSARRLIGERRIHGVATTAVTPARTPTMTGNRQGFDGEVQPSRNSVTVTATATANSAAGAAAARGTVRMNRRVKPATNPPSTPRNPPMSMPRSATGTVDSCHTGSTLLLTARMAPPVAPPRRPANWPRIISLPRSLTRRSTPGTASGHGATAHRLRASPTAAVPNVRRRSGSPRAWSG
jgi:hypothetical protein